MSKRRMHLVGFVIAGPTWHHYGSWRHPESDALDALDPARYETIARVLEAGFDGLFFVDVLTLFDSYAGGFRTNLREAGQMYMMEPTQLLATMARATSHLGLAATMSTTFYPPSTSRAPSRHWITSARGARAGTLSPQPWTARRRTTAPQRSSIRSPRYDRADEVLEACFGLWDVGKTGHLSAIARTISTRTPTKCITSTTRENGSALAAR